MTVFLILGVLIAVFGVAIISPYAGGKIQRRSNQHAYWLKRLSNWLWDPLAWWAKTSVEFTRKAIVKASSLGKRIRRNLPF